MAKKLDSFYGTGRRKSSIARVYLKAGKGNIVVNGEPVDKYFPFATLVLDLKQPLTVLGVQEKYDIDGTVLVVGFEGQSGAIRLGIARALLEAGEDRKALKANGLLTS